MQIPGTPAKDLAALIKATVIGLHDQLVTGLNEIHRVQPGDCAFVDHPRYYDRALNSHASTIIINKETTCPPGKTLLVHPEPFSAFNQLTCHFSPRIYATQPISDTSRVGSGTVIMPGCFIGNHVVIGSHCVIHPNVVIYDHCTIGNNVTIHANTTIGSDAFYFKKRESSFEPLYTCGTVTIGDDVVIGANCSVDRGVTATTHIGKGTVIDNQVHVGHDVLIGEYCLFAAQVGIAGAVTIGNKVTVWGQVGISSGLLIGDGVTIMAQSGVAENLAAGKTYFGTPASEAREKKREIFAVKQLPGLIHKLYDKED